MTKRVFSMLLAVVLLATLLPLPRIRAAQEQEYLTYLVVDGEVRIQDCDTGISGEVVIPARIDGYPVTEISNYAFQGCKNITSVVIPEGVESVGAYAFSQCTALTQVVLPESVKEIGEDAFYLDYALRYSTYENGKYLGNSENPYVALIAATSLYITTLNIHSRTRILANRAFYDCRSLTSVTVPDSLVTIGSGAFINSANLNYNVFGEGKYLGNAKNPYRILMGPISSDIDQLTTHEKTQIIADSALRGCDQLLAVSITPSVTTICDGAFFNCISLQTVFMGDGVKTIGVNAFGACSLLQNIAWSQNIQTIDDYAFSGNWSLTEVFVPATVTFIGKQAFGDCNRLMSITVDENNPVYSSDEAGALLNKNKSVLLSVPNGLTEYTIAQNVTAVAPYAFYECRNLLTVSGGENVISIGKEAFYYCTSLTGINLGKNVKEIGEEAFYYCTDLEGIWVDEENSVYSSDSSGVLFSKDKTVLWRAPGTIAEYTVPETVHTIQKHAFQDCEALKKVTVGSSVQVIEDYAFGSCGRLEEVTIQGENCSIGSGAFWYCRDLHTLTLGEGVTAIGEDAFAYCESLSQLTLPDSLTTIGSAAFEKCTGLESLTLGTGVTQVSANALSGCTGVTSVTVPEGIASLWGWSFTSCKSLQYTVWGEGKYLGNAQNPYLVLADTTSTELTRLEIHKDTRFMLNFALQYCNKLTDVVISEGVTEIGRNAFYGCTALTEIQIPDTVTRIGSTAFQNTGLVRAVIGKGVTTIEDNAFRKCAALSAISVHPENTAYSSDENGALYNKEKSALIAVPAMLSAYTAPAGLRKIASYAFDSCKELTEITLADVATIEDYAFYNCKNLSEITFTGNSPVIDRYGFYDVTATAYYPAGNASWTEDIMQNYSGTLTWKVDCKVHAVTVMPAAAPTCTATGLTEGAYCEKCGEVLTAQEEIPALGHSWDGGIYTEPTYTADGYTTFTCATCGETRVEINEGSKLQIGSIVKQPENVTADSGNDVQFKVEATGQVVSYKWEYRKIYKWFNTSMEGYNTDTLTVPATGARNGYDYRCTVTFADGTVMVSEPAELTVNTYITGIQNPNDQTAVLGYKGQFTAAAEGEGIKYQWQYCRPGSEKWINTAMEGATKPTVMIETTTARDGYQYRCEITDVTGNVVYTAPATMRVLSFKSHPVESFAPTSGTVQFTVTTSVDSGFSYQWQYRRNATGNWTNTTLTGYNTATLTVPAKGKNGYAYRCVLTGAKNSKLESNGAVLHVGDPVVITTQPADVTCAVGEVAAFTVEATNVYSYQWQYRRPSSTSWSNTSADGNQTPELKVTVKANNNGYQYRCELFGLDGTRTHTDPVTLTVPSEKVFAITQQPVSRSAGIGETVEFTVAANGADCYRWQYCKSGTTTWLSTTMEGHDTPSLSVPVLKSRNGYQYRCVVTNADKVELISDAATLTVGAVSIAAQPTDFAGVAGQNAVFAVRTEESDLGYRWQYRKSAAGSWFNTSATGNATDTLTVSVEDSRNGYQYRCVITDGNGVQVYTRPATLTVTQTAAPAVRITAQPTSRVAADTETVMFATAATGEVSYQWQFRRNATGTWANTSMTGNKTAAITLPAKGKDGYEYRCIITDKAGNQIITDEVILTVE